MRSRSPLTALLGLPWYPKRTPQVMALQSAEAKAAMAILTAKARLQIDRSHDAVSESRACLVASASKARAIFLLKDASPLPPA